MIVLRISELCFALPEQNRYIRVRRYTHDRMPVVWSNALLCELDVVIEHEVCHHHLELIRSEKPPGTIQRAYQHKFYHILRYQ